MKRNDLEMVSVKEWGSPRSNIQLFVPQEYCESCYIQYSDYGPLSKYSSTIIFDYTNIGTYDTGERFTSSGGGGTAGRYSDVKAYYIKDGSAIANRTPPNGTPLGDNFTFVSNNKTFTFKEIGTFNIEIQQKAFGTKAYVKTGNAS
ncbi:MAG: hypothetical protein Q4D30_10740 [Bacteroidales bacterium]|nr:hypothetical protein [Bacteroidales bacterium]